MTDIAKSLTIPQIVKLHGTGNYHTWRSIAVTFQDIMGMWDVVSGKKTKPAANNGEASAMTAEDWTHLSQRAKGFLLLSVDRGLTPLMSSAQDALSVCTKYEEKFDRKTASSLHSLLKPILP
jgi:hypothetical protein